MLPETTILYFVLSLFLPNYRLPLSTILTVQCPFPVARQFFFLIIIYVAKRTATSFINFETRYKLFKIQLGTCFEN